MKYRHYTQYPDSTGTPFWAPELHNSGWSMAQARKHAAGYTREHQKRTPGRFLRVVVPGRCWYHRQHPSYGRPMLYKLVEDKE